MHFNTSVSLTHHRQNESTEETDAVNNPSSVSPARTDPPQNNSETNIDEGDTDSTAVAPRVMLDADGNIIVDEERYNLFCLKAQYCSFCFTFLCYCFGYVCTGVRLLLFRGM